VLNYQILIDYMENCNDQDSAHNLDDVMTKHEEGEIKISIADLLSPACKNGKSNESSMIFHTERKVFSICDYNYKVN